MKAVSRLVITLLLAASFFVAAPALATYHGGPGGWQPTPEFDGGCEIVGTAKVDSLAGRTSCAYLSHGPGSFSGQASTGWCVRIWRAGERISQLCHDWQVYTGDLNTQEGDVVELLVANFCLFYPPGSYHCSAGLYPGFVSAGDKS